MKCKECIIKEKDLDLGNSPILCAFETGRFSIDNWNCGTMDILREQVEGIWNDDNNAGLIPIEDGYLYLQWYKSRGATDKLMVIAEDGCYIPYLEDLKQLLI